MRDLLEHIQTLLRVLGAMLPPSSGEIQDGDIVQIRPEIDAVWGGALLRVRRAKGELIEGCFLQCVRDTRESWLSYKRGQVIRLGRIAFRDDWQQLTTMQLAGEAAPPRDLRALARELSPTRLAEILVRHNRKLTAAEGEILDRLLSIHANRKEPPRESLQLLENETRADHPPGDRGQPRLQRKRNTPGVARRLAGRTGPTRISSVQDLAG